MTMTNDEITAHIAIDEHDIAIQGYGNTAADAIDMALREAGPLHDAEGSVLSVEEAVEKFVTFPATAALIQSVEDYGGQTPYDVKEDGVADVPSDEG